MNTHVILVPLIPFVDDLGDDITKIEELIEYTAHALDVGIEINSSIRSQKPCSSTIPTDFLTLYHIKHYSRRCYDLTEFFQKVALDIYETIYKPARVRAAGNAIELVFEGQSSLNLEINDPIVTSLAEFATELFFDPRLKAFTKSSLPTMITMIEIQDFDDFEEAERTAKSLGLNQYLDGLWFSKAGIFNFALPVWNRLQLPLRTVVIGGRDNYRSRQELGYIMSCALALAELYNLEILSMCATWFLEYTIWELPSMLERFIHNNKVVSHYFQYDEKKLVDFHRNFIEHLTIITRRKSLGSSKSLTLFGEFADRSQDLLSVVESLSSALPKERSDNQLKQQVKEITDSWEKEIDDLSRTSIDFIDLFNAMVAEFRSRLQVQVGFKRLNISIWALIIAVLGFLVTLLSKIFAG